MSLTYELSTVRETPPDGWRYTQKETGRKFSTYDWPTFENDIRSHRLANGIKLSPDWKEELQDELCKDNIEKWGPNWCRRYSTKKVKRKGFSFGAAISFLNFLWNWIKAGGGYVEQEEAERRARICSTCEFNVELSSNCGACVSSLMSVVSKLRGGRKTSFDNKLHNCQVCSCVNKVSVHLPVEPQFAALSESVKETFKSIDYCWKKLQ